MLTHRPDPEENVEVVKRRGALHVPFYRIELGAVMASF